MADDPLLEQQLADLLAEYDSDLATGSGARAGSPPLDPGLEERFHDAAECLRLLDQLRPRGEDAPCPEDTSERYELRQLHATGGIGRVWVAYDSELGREVALKELRPDRLADPALAARFLNEARITGRLQHPGIVPVYEMAPENEDGPAYYTMRFVRGQTFTEAVRAHHEARSPDRVGLIRLLGAFVRVCQTIAYAHTQGVVHCDLKGQNVILGDFGEVIVLDWGLASSIGEADYPGRVTRRLPGTPAYMAPEQARGQVDRLGPRTDIFGLGAILYEILTGRPPFVADDSGDALELARQSQPVRPRDLAPRVSPALTAVCLKALAVEPEQRYATATELATEVQHWLADEPVEAYRESVAERAQRWGRRHRAHLAVMLAVLVTSLVALVFISEARWRVVQTEAKAELDHAGLRMRAALDLKAGLEQQLYFQRVALAERELAAHHVVRSLGLLANCPEHLRGWEWMALQRLCHSGPRILREHRGAVSAVAYSPDGKRLVTASHDRTLLLWDPVTARCLGPIGTQADAIYDVAFHPDGRRIATACWDGTFRIWDVDKKAVLHEFRGPGDRVFRLAFSPDGELLACLGATEEVQVREVETGKVRFTLTHDTDRLYRVAFSPNGKLLAVTSMRGVHLWELQRKDPPRLLSSGGEYVKCLAFSPDSKILATGEGDLANNDAGTVRLWDTTAGPLLATLEGHAEPIFGLTFSPDGTRLFSASQDKTVKVWDVTQMQESLTLRGHTDTVRAVAMSPDGKQLATAGADGHVILWDSNPQVVQASYPVRHRLVGHEDAVVAVVWPKGQRDVFSMDPQSEVRRWDSLAGTLKATWPTEEKTRGFGLAASSDGKHLAMAFNDGKVRIVERSGEVVQVLGDHLAGPIKSVAFSPDNTLVATAGWDQTVGLWPVDGSPGRKLIGHKDAVLGVAFHPNGKQLASAGYDNTVRLWELPEGRLVKTLPGHPSRILSVSYNPEGTLLASGGNDNAVGLWDARTGEAAGRLEGHLGAVSAVAFSPGGEVLASASHDCTVKLWNVSTREEIVTLRGHVGRVYALAFAEDGAALVSASQDRTLRVWSLADLQPAR